jgi:regulatory protein YycH of two-component signal transduction system YycFG
MKEAVQTAEEGLAMVAGLQKEAELAEGAEQVWEALLRKEEVLVSEAEQILVALQMQEAEQIPVKVLL